MYRLPISRFLFKLAAALPPRASVVAVYVILQGALRIIVPLNLFPEELTVQTVGTITLNLTGQAIVFVPQQSYTVI